MTPTIAAPLRAVDSCRRTPTGLVATLEIRADEEALRGHFPGLPIYPGVFVLESVLQALSLAHGSPARLRELRSVRFMAPLLPGDEMTLDVTTRREVAKVAATRRDGSKAAELTLEISYDAAKPYKSEPVSGDQDKSDPGPSEPPSGAIEHAQVRHLLPQRYPLLLVDRVVDLRPGRSITALKAVTSGEPCYRGLPGGLDRESYAYPVSLLLESIGQTAALLWLADAGAVGDDHVLMFAAARNYRVTGEAHPGDLLRHEVEVTQVKADTVFATGVTYADDAPIASAGTLIAVRRPRSVLASPNDH